MKILGLRNLPSYEELLRRYRAYFGATGNKKKQEQLNRAFATVQGNYPTHIGVIEASVDRWRV